MVQAGGLQHLCVQTEAAMAEPTRAMSTMMMLSWRKRMLNRRQRMFHFFQVAENCRNS
jgi:hypothetical protein